MYIIKVRLDNYSLTHGTCYHLMRAVWSQSHARFLRLFNGVRACLEMHPGNGYFPIMCCYRLDRIANRRFHNDPLCNEQQLKDHAFDKFGHENKRLDIFENQTSPETWGLKSNFDVRPSAPPEKQHTITHVGLINAVHFHTTVINYSLLFFAVTIIIFYFTHNKRHAGKYNFEFFFSLSLILLVFFFVTNYEQGNVYAASRSGYSETHVNGFVASHWEY